MSDLSGLGPKRFYKRVDVKTSDSLDSSKAGLRYVVTVDGKSVKTPKRHVLATPSEVFSSAVAAEWDEQKDRIRPSSMPLTGLACAALDIVPEFREKMIKSIMRFLHTDTACVRPDTPKELVAAQNSAFDPIIEHCSKGDGLQSEKMEINIARGSLAAPQSERIEKWLSQVVNHLDHWSLAAMDSAAGSSKSILVATALKDGAISAQQALEAARSEELWQSRVWGVVEGGHDMDDADALVRLTAADMVFRFVEMDRAAFEKASEALMSSSNS